MKNITLPKHVAIIPDGNRRWATERGLPTFEGHRRGFETLIKVAKKAREIGIKTFTVWAFSTENWNRTSAEVTYLMELYLKMTDRYLKDALKEEIRIIHLGRKDRLSEELRRKITNAEEKTKKFSKFYTCIALDYGGRDEIIRALRKKQITEEKDLTLCLDTSSLPHPEPDLVIRTGGEKRLSGFMLWQIEYSELMFVDKYLPDFTSDEFTKCIAEYSKRKRRFGK